MKESSISVLVVDDEPDLRFLMRLVLEGVGYGVTEAANGVDALKRIQQSRPDVVITDLMMPKMGGRELISHLQADRKLASIPIIVVSASIGGAALGVAECMEKPFQIEELVAAMRRCTGFQGDAS